MLWSSLIVLGTFLRGPNWNFFGPFEFWDIHKLEALTNVNLSEYIWVRALRTGLPTHWFMREIFGHPARAVLRLRAAGAAGEDAVQGVLREAGRAALLRRRAFLFLMMMSLPIKMLARWIFNLKYIVGIPEFFFNI